MKYHDNQVKFTLNPASQYSLAWVRYTVNDFYITSGQDPLIEIKQGYVASGSDTLSFKVGRKDSTDTGDWLNNQVAPNQTTFNHSADKLNFAFIGTLELTINGGSLTEDTTFTFQDIVLAQGHENTSNNWWFGGKECTFIPEHSASCNGTDSNGTIATFVFLRGYNSVSTVQVSVAIPS